jgi:ethanolamine utilization protein EutN
LSKSEFNCIKLLLLQPLNEKLEEVEEPVVACDTVQAGLNDIVFYEGGREAALGLKNWFNPSDLTIIGIVDQVNIGE